MNLSGISLQVVHNLPHIHIESRALKYGYANARVKGMKGLLLKEAFLDELMQVKTIDGMVELLQRTHYRDELVALSLQFRGSYLVELAASKHFIKIVEKVKKFAPKSDAIIIENLLRRWDLLNLKILIDSKRLKKSFEDIKPYLVTVGLLKLGDFERLTKLDGEAFTQEVNKIITQMGALQTQKKKTKNLDNVKVDLDSSLYELIDRALRTKNPDLERIRKLFRKETDAKNILIIFRLKGHGVPKEKIRPQLIKGGTLKDSDIKQLLDAKDLASATPLLKSLFKFVSMEKINSVVDLEIAIENALAKEKVSLFHRSILSVGVLLGFILLKEEEMHNVRKIAKAKEFGIPFEQIKKTLVIV